MNVHGLAFPEFTPESRSTFRGFRVKSFCRRRKLHEKTDFFVRISWKVNMFMRKGCWIFLNIKNWIFNNTTFYFLKVINVSLTEQFKTRHFIFSILSVQMFSPDSRYIRYRKLNKLRCNTFHENDSKDMRDICSEIFYEILLCRLHCSHMFSKRN